MAVGKSPTGIKAFLLGLGVLSALAAAAVAQEAAQEVDPLVQLDAAKTKLGDGKLAAAGEMLRSIPAQTAEAYIVEEILLHRLLLSGAHLQATSYVLREVEEVGEENGHGYAQWLSSKRAEHAAEFVQLAQDYLRCTADGPQLDFVRFRLPTVTVDHLADVELYTDPEILRPAMANWEDGREGLGKGVIGGQARVALVLTAARYYDRPEAAESLGQVVDRLAGGVPLDYLVTLDWVAESASAISGFTAEAARVAADADARLLALTESTPGNPLRDRALARRSLNNAEVEAFE